MRIRVGEHIAECIIADPSDCQCLVRFFAGGASRPRWERRFEVSKDTGGGFEQPALGVDRFRVRQGQIELAYYRYERGPGGREPSRVVRLALDGEIPDSPQTRPVRALATRTVDAVVEAPAWSVLPLDGEVSVGAVLHALDQGDSHGVAQMLNATANPDAWQLAVDRGAAPRDWASVSLSQWAFVPAGSMTVPLWVAREPMSIHRWVELCPEVLGPARASLPPLLRSLDPADASARPVTHVAWHEAAACCDALSRRHQLEPVGKQLEGALHGASDVWDAAATVPATYRSYARETVGFRLPVLAEWSMTRGLAGRCTGCAGHGLTLAEDGAPGLCPECSGVGAHTARRVGDPPALASLGQANEWGVCDAVGNVLVWTVHAPASGRRAAAGAMWSPAPVSLPVFADPRVGVRPVRTAPM